jgi:PAS domain S-box-containing protein
MTSNDPRRESEERFRMAFAHASVGMAMTSPEGRYLEVNRAFCEITGYREDELLDTDFQSITHPDDLPDLLRWRRQLLAGEVAGFVIEKRYLRSDGSVVWVQNSAALARDLSGEPATVVTLVQDVTRRKEAERALRETEDELRGRTELLQTIFDNVPAMIGIIDRGGHILWANREWLRVLGWSQAELQQVDILTELFPDPADKAEVVDYLARALPGWREFRPRARNGRILHTAWMTALLSDGRIIGIGRDLTDGKRTEAEREELLRRLAHLQEEERRAIARELHDEVGQLLTGLGLMLEAEDAPGAGVRRQEMKRLVGELIERVRDLSMKLRPPMLDELGLQPTLLWQIERFEVQTGIQVEFRHANLDRRLPSEIEVATYHVVQEALNNVARHAGVATATVDVWAGPGALGARIKDGGRGFVVEEALRGRSSGLAGMRERCRLLGGEATIESAPGTGTCVAIELPLSAAGPSGAVT